MIYRTLRRSLVRPPIRSLGYLQQVLLNPGNEGQGVYSEI